MIETPKVDTRTRETLVGQLRQLAAEVVPAWQPVPKGGTWPGGDPGAALMEIAAHFAEIVIDRLNRSLDSHLLAFLNLVGVGLLPPTAARVPAQFFLANGAAAEAVVPEDTPLATAGSEPLQFETEKRLVVSAARLVEARTIDPQGDRHTDHGTAGAANGALQEAFHPFAGTALIPHALSLGDETLLRIGAPTQVRLQLDVEQVGPEHVPPLATLSWWAQSVEAPGRLPASAQLNLSPYGGGQDLAGQSLAGTVHSGGVGSRTLTGIGTAFTQELAVGAALLLPGEGERVVTAIASDTSLEVDGAVTLDPPGVQGARLVLPPLTGTAHTAGAASSTLTGVGTAFTRELRPGDVVFGPGVAARTVRAVASDTSLSLDGEVTVAGPPGVPLTRRLPRQLRGSVHTAGGASRTLQGVGTIFTQEVRAGDRLQIAGAGVRTVSVVASDDSLTLDQEVSVAGPPGVPVSRLYRGTLRLTLDPVPSVGSRGVGDQTAHWIWGRTELPIVNGSGAVQVRSASAATALKAPVPPDLVFANAQPLDLGRAGGFAFGERPRLNDILYLGSQEVLSRRGAAVSIAVSLNFPVRPDPDAVPTVGLAWEYWNGAVWASLGNTTQAGSTTGGFSDATRALTAQGSAAITFTCPPIVPTEVNGQANYWIRARINSGNYGQDARMTKKVADPKSLADWDYAPPSFRPPFIAALGLSYAYATAQTLGRVVTQDHETYASAIRQADGSLPSFPMLAPLEGEAALYLGFDRPLANLPFSLYAAVVEQEARASLPSVAWEYRGADGWKPLGAQDETKSLTEPGTVEFLGPSDLARSSEPGTSRYWIRARLADGDGSQVALCGVFPNAVWARHAITLQREIIGSSTGRPGLLCRLSRTPVLAGEQIEVREPEVPSAEALQALAADGDLGPVQISRDAAGRITEVWVRWHGVEHFHLSGPASRHYSIDRQSGEVWFGDGVRGMIPPAGRDNIRAALYRAGGGRAGNVGAGALTVMKRAIASVDHVRNPVPAGGGSDQESQDAVRERGPLVLKHRDRAVSFEDYEWLAREASLQVARARCLPARDAATAGQVRLVLVPDSDEGMPVPSPGLLRLVQEQLDSRRILTADLTLLAPTYVQVSVVAEVVPVSLDEADVVGGRVADRLAAYLHPLRGGAGGSGWSFGRDVYVSEIAAVIERTEGVDYLKGVSLQGLAGGEDRTRDGGQRVEVLEEGGELVASGRHTITLAPS
jgi:hypothetical protein